MDQRLYTAAAKAYSPNQTWKHLHGITAPNDGGATRVNK
jgi:hypothetical protein